VLPLKSLVSLGLSQYGWCLLKSLSHRICTMLLFCYDSSDWFLLWKSISRCMVLSLWQSL
jgi:hypothetical protein